MGVSKEFDLLSKDSIRDAIGTELLSWPRRETDVSLSDREIQDSSHCLDGS